MTTIVAKNITKKFNKIIALDSISFKIQKGKITGLVGPDAAGKTTLLRICADLLRFDEGELEIARYKLPQNIKNIQSYIGYMPQKFGLYEDLSVEENLKLYADLQNIDRSMQEKRITELLEFSSLSNFKDFLAGKLSGGMKQKLGLCCALIKKPKILLLDEPGVGVDPISRKELWKMVKALSNDDIAILWSTSYLDEAGKFDEVILLNEGKILFDGMPFKLAESMKGKVFKIVGNILDKRKTLKLILEYDNIKDAIILGNKIKLVCELKEQLPNLIDIQAENCRYENEEPTFEDGFINILNGNFDGKSLLADQMNIVNEYNSDVIEAKNLTKKFDNFIATDNVNFTIKKGEIFGFLGPNGAGKSTTFKMLCGLMTPTSGQAKVLGKILDKSNAKIRLNIGYMSQKFSLYEDISVVENLLFFAGIYGLKSKAKKNKIENMLEIFDLKKYKKTASKDLPLGYKQRLALACAVMHDPAVLFLDEPTSGVDPKTRREFWNHIYAMVHKGMSIMVTTHFMDEAEYCDRIALIYKGKAIALGTPEELMAMVSAEATMEDAFIHLIEKEI